MNEWLTFFLDGGDGGGSGSGDAGQGDAEGAGNDAKPIVEMSWTDEDKAFLGKAGIDVGKVDSDPGELAKAIAAFRDGSVETAKKNVELSKANRELKRTLKAQDDNQQIADAEGKLTPEGQKAVENMKQQLAGRNDLVEQMREAGLIDDRAYEILSQQDVSQAAGALGQLKNQQQSSDIEKRIADGIKAGMDEFQKNLYQKLGLAPDAPDNSNKPLLMPDSTPQLGALGQKKGFSVSLAEEVRKKQGQ